MEVEGESMSLEDLAVAVAVCEESDDAHGSLGGCFHGFLSASLFEILFSVLRKSFISSASAGWTYVIFIVSKT